MKKLSYEYVKEQIESTGYKLLSSSYINSQSPLTIHCSNPEHPPYNVKYYNFQQGKRCPYCYGNAPIKFEEKENFITLQKYKLISNVDSRHVIVSCPDPSHPEYKTSFYAFKNGGRCAYCYGNVRKDYNEVKEHIENLGYRLLSTQYINKNEKLRFLCPNNHTFEMTYGNFNNGKQRCPECSISKKKTYNFIKENIEKYGFLLIDDEYVNAKKKMSIRCLNNHIFQMCWNSWQRGARCPKCAGNSPLTQEYIEEIFNREEYILLGKISSNIRRYFLIECPKGHKYKARIDHFRNGLRCRKCTGAGSSIAEKEILEKVKEVYEGNIIENDRSQTYNRWTRRKLELDIFLPDENKAIEYNGIHWHDGKYFPKKIWSDEMKKKQCKVKNIDLLVIKEEDWMKDSKVVLENVKSFINNINRL